MRHALAALFFLPALALAGGSGSWQASSTGAVLSYRGVEASSPALAPTQPVTGVMTQVFWRWQLTGPIPAGLQVKLCSLSRCAAIEGASGSTRGLTNVAASEPLRFVWQVPGGGRLFPIMRVQSNQVIVNYQ